MENSYEWRETKSLAAVSELSTYLIKQLDYICRR